MKIKIKQYSENSNLESDTQTLDDHQNLAEYHEAMGNLDTLDYNQIMYHKQQADEHNDAIKKHKHREMLKRKRNATVA